MITHKFSYDNKHIFFETGRLAKQAHGSVLVTLGGTVVLAAVVQAEKAKENIDFFPLTVEFEEKMYAAGKIKGSRFIKREGRASDEAIISARLIDRSIRPLFPLQERKEVQVAVSCLSFDGENDPDILGLIATSAALHISPIKWHGPIGASRVASVNGKVEIYPTYAQRLSAQADVVISSRNDQLVMIDLEGHEVPEAEIISLLEKGISYNNELEMALKEFALKCGVQKSNTAENQTDDTTPTLLRQKVISAVHRHIHLALDHKSKESYRKGYALLAEAVDTDLKLDSNISAEERGKVPSLLEDALDHCMRIRFFEEKKRIDGRLSDEIRPLAVEVGVLPRVHGSGLFTRGETQVLTVATLGAPGDEQIIDSMESDSKKRYLHHYNFPGFSVGEPKPMRGPGRREIGHGALAEKALEPVIPTKEDFPYTIRLVSEVLESNGSSSQASVCGSTLALMDAGVPLVRPVAGVAMGLLTHPDSSEKWEVITDIQGLEDHLGDMDFKVAGSEVGVTAIQLDIKLGGIPIQVAKDALKKAKIAREKILQAMLAVLPAPRAELSPYAPRVKQIKIKPEKIREVIGTGGKVINGIISATGATLDVEDDGSIFITSPSAEGMNKAVEMIQNIVREVEVGAVYNGKVTRLMDFGAFVEVLPGKEGLVHVSEIDWQRVNLPSDVLKVGQSVTVKAIEIDGQGRLNLSIKQLLPKPSRNSNSRQDPEKVERNKNTKRLPYEF